MCRTVFWWDTGELAANAKILGIAHRPGFPLYILIGHLFGMVPFGDFFYRINFLSALCSAVTLALLAGIWLRSARHANREAPPSDLTVAICLVAIAIGGTYTFWMQAVRAEVYAPSMLLIALLFGCAWRYNAAVSSRRTEANRWLVAAALLAGLGMGLHNATVASTLPAFFLFFAFITRHRGFDWRRWSYALLAFGIGVSVYFYMPIRAGQNPALNWGWLPIDRSPGWHAVIATDSWNSILAGDLVGFFTCMGLSGRLLFNQWESGLILLAVAGVMYWWRHGRKWVWLTAGVGIGNLAVTALLVTDFSETNADIHGYLLPALCGLGFFLFGGITLLTTGLRSLAERLTLVRYRPILLGTAVVFVTLLAVAPLLIYAPFCNLVQHRLAYDYSAEATARLEANAVVFLAGVNLDFVLRGMQHCEDWRADLRFLNRDLMPAAWYRHWVFSRFPDLGAVPIPSDTTKLDLRQWALNLAAEGIPVYWEFTEIDMHMAQHLLPAGHLFKVSAEPQVTLGARAIRAQEEFERQSRFYAASNRILHDYDAQMVYVAGLYRAGLYYESRGLYERARQLFRRALSLGEDNEQVRSITDRLPPGFSLESIDRPAPLDQTE
jgi:hypothetical protein